MGKTVTYGKEARQALLDGVDFLANAVRVTLGPGGGNVAIGRRLLGLNPHVSKDGVTVANHVNPTDPKLQIAADLTREAANKTVQAVGDGTTTTVTLVQAMLHLGTSLIDSGVPSILLKRQMDIACGHILTELDRMAIPITTPEQIFNIANISSNGDADIATTVCDAFKQVGVDGVVAVEESGTALTEFTVTNGIQFRSGEFLSVAFANDPMRFVATYDDAYILLFEASIDTAKSLAPLLAAVAKEKRPLLLIAGDWQLDALSCIVLNHTKAGAPWVAVKTGLFGDQRRELLLDIAAVTGGTAILEDSGTKIENVAVTHLGQARKIIVSDITTTVVDGLGTDDAVLDRVEQIKSKEGYDKARLAQLVSGIANIKVGGTTLAEMKEKKDRFDDAAGATRAAIEGGFVPGGGLALIKAQARLPYRSPGMSVVSQACVEPLKQIARNAGFDPDAVVYRIVGHSSYQRLANFYGFDAAKGDYTDLVARGVIDPVRVVKEALKNAVSIAGTLLTTQCIVSESLEDLSRPQ